MNFTRLLLLISLLIGCLALPSTTLASGGGAKKPAGHGAEAKKSGGHGAAKKDAKKESHKKDGHKKDAHKSGHGAAKSEPETASPASKHVADVEKILSLIAGKERKHDPRLYLETDLGEFRVTHSGVEPDEIFVLKFHIYGVLHEQDLVNFANSTEGREQRLRDAVLSVVHRAEYEQLLDPALDAVKSNLATAINRVLESDFVRDVAFSSFSMERNY